MGENKGGRPRTAVTVRCPQPGHGHADIRPRGKRILSDGSTRQRYRCDPGLAGDTHEFSVLLDGKTSAEMPIYSPPPACPIHGSSRDRRVVRDGRYGAAGSRRQQYRCERIPPKDPDEGAAFDRDRHRFTPDLPRKHIHIGEDRCDVCDELIGANRGQPAAARRTSWDMRIVAEGLIKLADGSTYSEVSIWAWEATHRDRTKAAALSDEERERRQAIKDWNRQCREAKRAIRVWDELPDCVRSPERPTLPEQPELATTEPLPPGTNYSRRRRVKLDGTPVTRVRKRSAGAKLAAARWHTAADWVELYGPALWAPFVRGLASADKDEAARRRALGSDEARIEDGRPHILMLDDVLAMSNSPFAIGGGGNQLNYAVLGAARTIWKSDKLGGRDETVAGPQIRLLRAYPSRSIDAYLLLLDELGYGKDDGRGGILQPDFVICDGADSIARAVRQLCPGAVLVPSIWHIRNNIEEALRASDGAVGQADEGRELHPEISRHLRLLGAQTLRTMDEQRLRGWWRDLHAMMTRLRIPTSKVENKRKSSEEAMVRALRHLSDYSDIAVSTGGYERQLRSAIGSVITDERSAAFRSIERLNSLLDLVVLRRAGQLNSASAVAKQLLDSVAQTDGWAAQPREIADLQTVEGQTYSSLRDEGVLRAMVRARGLR